LFPPKYKTITHEGSWTKKNNSKNKDVIIKKDTRNLAITKCFLNIIVTLKNYSVPTKILICQTSSFKTHTLFVTSVKGNIGTVAWFGNMGPFLPLSKKW